MAGIELLHGRGHAGEGMQSQHPQWKTVTVKGSWYLVFSERECYIFSLQDKPESLVEACLLKL